MTDRELMQQALNVLKIFVDGGNSAWARKIIEIKEALRDRLAQPEQEPVWVEVTTNTGDKFILDSAVEADKIRAARDAGLLVVPLYTAPPQRDEAPAKAVEWQGLTDEEILEEYRQSYGDDGNLTDIYFAHAIEAKLKDKNHAV